MSRVTQTCTRDSHTGQARDNQTLGRLSCPSFVSISSSSSSFSSRFHEQTTPNKTHHLTTIDYFPLSLPSLTAVSLLQIINRENGTNIRNNLLRSTEKGWGPEVPACAGAMVRLFLVTCHGSFNIDTTVASVAGECSVCGCCRAGRKHLQS